MDSKTKWNLAFSVPAFLLLAAALWQAYVPYASRLQDIGGIRASIVPVTPAALAEKLRHKPHLPTLLYIYASWCGKCGQVMPHLAGIIREHEHDDVRFIFVSVDQSETPLMDYLVRTHYDGLFVPYIADGALPPMLQTFGGHYTGGIPYMMFFDRKGRITQEFYGVMPRDAILASLKQIEAD